VTVASHDRKGLERLCRYLSRPPIPQLSAGRGGASSREATASTCCRSSSPPQGSGRSARGIKAVVFAPLDLIARLAALVPAPYLALRRFHGVFAPNHHLRSLVVPTPCTDGAVPVAPKRPGRMRWADLLMRVWAIDALECPFCGGRMHVIAARGAGAQLLSFRTLTSSPPSSLPSTQTSGSFRPSDLPSRTRRSRAPRLDPPAFVDDAEEGPTAF